MRQHAEIEVTTNDFYLDTHDLPGNNNIISH